MSKILFPANGKPEFPHLTPQAIKGLQSTMQIAKKKILEQEGQIQSLKIQINNLQAVLQRVISGEWSVAELRRAWEESEKGEKS